MKLTVHNAIEQALLANELERANISASFITLESDVLGKSSQSGDEFGYFEVSTEDLPLAQEILDNLRQSAKEDAISPTKRNMVVTVPRILVSLLVLAQFVVIGYFVSENKRLEKLTHYAENVSEYNRKWNSDNTVLSRYYKDSGLLEAEYFDKNFNYKWEDEKFYDSKGRLKNWFHSDKDNGFNDTCSYFDTKGNLIQKFHNSPTNERNDRIEIYVDKNTVYEFTESPQGDKFYEVKKVVLKPGE